MFELYISSVEYIEVKIETGASSTIFPQFCMRSDNIIDEEISRPDFALIHVIKPEFTPMLDEVSAMPIL